MLDGRKGAEVVLNNIGEEPAVYRVSVEFRRMDEDGGLTDVSEPTADDQKAADMIIYAPRRVTLAPHQPQAIRIAARPPQGLPDGEYRVHLLFRAIPPATPVVQRAALEPEKGLRFQLTPVYGVTIPVIVRLGNLQATAGIANVHLDKGKDGNSVVSVDLSRSGTRSTFGEVRVLKAGVKDPIALQKGVAVYTEVNKRKVPIPVSPAYKGRSPAPSPSNMSRPSTTVRTCSPKLRRCCARARTGSGDLVRCLAACKWLRKAALLLALCAGGVGASAPLAGGSSWRADPDDQFLLDVNIRQLRLGDGVRAYNTPEGTCVVLGDFLTTLDVPMRIDLTAKKASGWAFKENNRISIDYGAGAVTYAGKSEALAPGTIRETPEGWCVQTAALSRWFGIGVKPVTTGSVLVLQSDAKLPVELAMERQQRAAHIRPASFDLSSLPQVRIPYRMWRAPALDFVVSAGLTYRASDGMRVDRQSSVFAAGEIAHLSYDAQITTTQKGKPSLLRLRAYRSDPDGGLLGPLHATHFGMGDVEGFDSGLTGSVAAGRGAVITNRPLSARAAFDRTRFEGDLPSGWEAEIYRNGELLAFAKANSSQRYVFEDVQLLYGENQIQIILYGPQGQVRTRDEVVNVGQDNVPAGKTWYWAGFNQPGRDIVELEKPPDGTVLTQGASRRFARARHRR